MYNAPPVVLFSTFPFLLHLHSSLSIEYEEEYEDVIVNQMLVPKSQDTDTTEILNNLLKEYDKKLRPDIGGNRFSWLIHCCCRINDIQECKDDRAQPAARVNKTSPFIFDHRGQQ